MSFETYAMKRWCAVVQYPFRTGSSLSSTPWPSSLLGMNPRGLCCSLWPFARYNGLVFISFLIITIQLQTSFFLPVLHSALSPSLPSASLIFICYYPSPITEPPHLKKIVVLLLPNVFIALCTFLSSSSKTLISSTLSAPPPATP